MGGLSRVWQVWNFMTRTQPNPLSKKDFVIQPNPTHHALKTDTTQRVGSGRVSFGELAGWLHTLTQGSHSKMLILHPFEKFSIDSELLKKLSIV